GETVLEKPSFKDSVDSKRCIIHLEGFYEHHHKLGQKFPFYIQDKEKDLICLAGLYSLWNSPLSGEQLTTFTIVTCKADILMTDIHNNPKLKEPRMPRILTELEQEVWLGQSTSNDELMELINKVDSSTPTTLQAHSVGPIRGTHASRNSPTAIDPVKYAVLESGEQLDLF
ncbi:MAG: SOS response-associated peptidase, partial [Bacteroidia bacterium]